MSKTTRRRRKYRDSARRQARQQQAMVVPTITDVVDEGIDPMHKSAERITGQGDPIRADDFDAAHEHERRSSFSTNEWKYAIFAVLLTVLGAMALNSWLG